MRVGGVVAWAVAGAAACAPATAPVGAMFPDAAPTDDAVLPLRLPDARTPPTCDPTGAPAGGACDELPADDPTYVMTDLPAVYDLALGADTVFVATTQGVYRADKCAPADDPAAPTQVVAGTAQLILSDGFLLYYVDSIGQLRLARRGDDPLLYAPASEVIALAHDDAAVYAL